MFCLSFVLFLYVGKQKSTTPLPFLLVCVSIYVKNNILAYCLPFKLLLYLTPSVLNPMVVLWVELYFSFLNIILLFVLSFKWFASLMVLVTVAAFLVAVCLNEI